uniref:Uncharacterized protein n=1 Tax=viral metagenome TaxID=1070528 RepID=A0A6C0D0N0_9ZZZZ
MSNFSYCSRQSYPIRPPQHHQPVKIENYQWNTWCQYYFNLGTYKFCADGAGSAGRGQDLADKGTLYVENNVLKAHDKNYDKNVSIYDKVEYPNTQIEYHQTSQKMGSVDKGRSFHFKGARGHYNIMDYYWGTERRLKIS